jgi:hypothetical protein
MLFFRVNFEKVTTMKTILEIANEFVAAGFDKSESLRLAEEQFRANIAMAQEVAKASAEKVVNDYNQHGLPGIVKRPPASSKSGASYVCCAEMMATITAGGSNAKTEFGPNVILHFVERSTNSGISPKPANFSAGSSSSNCRPEESAAWQAADLIHSTGCRLFITGENGEDKPAAEYTDRDEWLDEVRAIITEFYFTLETAKVATPVKRVGWSKRS